MTRSDVVVAALAVAGLASVVTAVVFERRMQRHRQPGVSYRDVTLRKDGGWRRADLFTPEGLALQRRAARSGGLGGGWGLLALAVWIALGMDP